MRIPEEWLPRAATHGQNPAYRPSGLLILLILPSSRCRGPCFSAPHPQFFRIIMKRNIILAMLSTLFLSGCSVFGIRSGTPEPKFSVVTSIGPVQIRHYAPRIAAETTIEANAETARYQGFRRLAGYIFGANHGAHTIAMTAPVAQSSVAQSSVAQSSAASTKIAMTAPVAQTHSAKGWTIRFYMPAQYTLETLPVPNDKHVHLITVPAADYAVLRFSGSRSPRTIAAKQALLLKSLANTAWHPIGTPDAWFYDPPWTLPPFRRNEVAVEVSQSSS